MVAALLVPEIVLTRIAGDQSTARSSLAIQAGTEVGLLLVVWVVLLAASAERNRISGKVRLARLNQVLEILLAAFVAIALLALGVGLARGNQTSFVIGDTYKFIAFPAFVYVLYYALNSPQTGRRAAKLVFAIILVTELGYTIYYLIDRSRLHVRPEAIYLCTWLPALLYCLRHDEPIVRRWGRAAIPLVVIAYLVISWFSQSLTLIAITLILLIGTMYFHRPRHFSRLFALLMFTGAIASSTVLLLGNDITEQGTAAITDPNYYLTRKFLFMYENGVSLRALELVGGDRVAQLVSVVNQWAADPTEMLLGQGMGGEIHVTSVTGLTNRSWKSENHYIEAGYPEVMLRTGLVGLFLYFGCIGWLLRRSISAARYDPYAALGAAYFLYVGIFSMFNEPLLGMGTESLFMVSFVTALFLSRTNNLQRGGKATR